MQKLSEFFEKKISWSQIIQNYLGIKARNSKKKIDFFEKLPVSNAKTNGTLIETKNYNIKLYEISYLVEQTFFIIRKTLKAK